MSPELERLAPERIRQFEIADLFPDLDEIHIGEDRENCYESRADEKAENDLFLKGHGLSYHQRKEK
jgi:hypothetical protein